MEGEGKTTLQAVSMGSCGWVAKRLVCFWLFWHHQTSSSQLGDSNLVFLVMPIQQPTTGLHTAKPLGHTPRWGTQPNSPMSSTSTPKQDRQNHRHELGDARFLQPAAHWLTPLPPTYLILN